MLVLMFCLKYVSLTAQSRPSYTLLSLYEQSRDRAVVHARLLAIFGLIIPFSCRYAMNTLPTSNSLEHLRIRKNY